MKRICVFGAGAIGGHVAARLARGGAEVSIVARGAQLEAVRQRGLKVQAFDGEHLCHLKASADPGDPRPAGRGDRHHQTDGAALGRRDHQAPARSRYGRGLRDERHPLVGTSTSTAASSTACACPRSIPGDALRKAVGVERTLGGVVYSSCTVVEPGVISTLHDRNQLILGELDGAISDRATALAAAISADGAFNGRVSPDMRAEVWTKLLGNISNGPLCILSRQSIGETMQDPVVFEAAKEMIREALAIAAALGRPLDVQVDKRISQVAGSRHKPSILQDLELGRPMEVEAQFATPLRLARHGGGGDAHPRPGDRPGQTGRRHGRPLCAGGRPDGGRGLSSPLSAAPIPGDRP